MRTLPYHRPDALEVYGSAVITADVLLSPDGAEEYGVECLVPAGDAVCNFCRWPLRDGRAAVVKVFDAAYIVTCRHCAGVEREDRPRLAPSGRRYSVLR